MFYKIVLKCVNAIGFSCFDGSSRDFIMQVDKMKYIYMNLAYVHCWGWSPHWSQIGALFHKEQNNRAKNKRCILDLNCFVRHYLMVCMAHFATSLDFEPYT
jgi:hypothetical protein